MKYIAQTISYILHPMLMPLYILFFIFNNNTLFAYIPWGVKLYCYLVTVFALLIMPVISLPLFKHFRLIRSYELNDKQERVYPILVAGAFAFVGGLPVTCGLTYNYTAVPGACFAFLGFWLLGRIGYTNIVRQLYLVLIILLSTFSVITFRWKISMHMTAIGGLCGFLLVWGMNYQGDVRNAFILFLLLSGILATSRLYLKKHTPLQVYLGFLFGLFFVFGILL